MDTREMCRSAQTNLETKHTVNVLVDSLFLIERAYVISPKSKLHTQVHTKSVL